MAPGKYASAWRDARRSDLTLLLATAASVQRAAAEQRQQVRQQQQRPASKRARKAEEPPAPGVLPEGRSVPVSNLLLATFSAYFRTLLDTELPTSSSALKDSEERRVLVVELDTEEEVQAAEALLELMYLEEVPAACSSNPQQLARMCHLADRWQAPECLRLCFSALACLPADVLTAEALTVVLPLLPFGTSSLRELGAELDGLVKRVVEALADVHAVLTTPALLRLLLALPFEVMLAWAGSDGLVVDSENSVVVALDCWVREGRGRDCGSEEELLQLSSLVRVQHLTPSYHMRLLELPWWHHDKGLTQAFSWGVALGATNLDQLDCPSAWTAAARKQLPEATLERRCALSWDVPRADLEEALSKEDLWQLWAPDTVYAAGHGMQLCVEVAAAGPVPQGGSTKRNVGAFIFSAPFDLAGVSPLPTTIPALPLNSLNIIALKAPDGSQALIARPSRMVLVKGWGADEAFAAAAMADLEPHLVEGHLKLRATALPVRSSVDVTQLLGV